MVMFTATVTVIAVLAAAASAHAQALVISRGGSRPVRPAPAQHFTGGAQVEMLFEAVDPSHASGGVGDVRARSPYCVAYASARPGSDHHGGHRARPAMG